MTEYRTHPLKPICSTCGQLLEQVAPDGHVMEMRCANSNCLAWNMKSRYPIRAVIDSEDFKA